MTEESFGSLAPLPLSLTLVGLCCACSPANGEAMGNEQDEASEAGGKTRSEDSTEPTHPPIVDVDGVWPWEPNVYSWDGSWNPEPEDFPLDGLLDSIYFDGHDVEGTASPILPPGEWDWEVTSLLANWRGFEERLGGFEPMSDDDERQFGWRLLLAEEDGVDADAVLQYFHGSSGADIVDLGADGSYHSAGNPLYGDPLNFGDGPDVFRFMESHSAVARLGSSRTGAIRDNDLVMIGSGEERAAGTYDVLTTGIHTGPGNDLVFANNWERSLIDLGNGEDGRTDSIDSDDRRDIAIIGGNARDFRVFGGRGDDLFVWHVDEVNQAPDTWLGPNFFGGGAWGDALYADTGVDRLVMNVPVDTQLVEAPGNSEPGTLLVFIEEDYDPVIDEPTEGDPYGRYYVTAPIGPDGQRTMTLQYQSADGRVDTAYFYVTDIEELQVGLGLGARVYVLDDVTGTATFDEAREPVDSVPERAQYDALISAFASEREY